MNAAGRTPPAVRIGAAGESKMDITLAGGMTASPSPNIGPICNTDNVLIWEANPASANCLRRKEPGASLGPTRSPPALRSWTLARIRRDRRDLGFTKGKAHRGDLCRV